MKDFVYTFRIPSKDSGKFVELSKLRTNRYLNVYTYDQIIQESHNWRPKYSFFLFLISLSLGWVYKHRGKIYLYQVTLNFLQWSVGIEGEVWRLDSCTYTKTGQLQAESEIFLIEKLIRHRLF